jgi:hypothetical protein
MQEEQEDACGRRERPLPQIIKNAAGEDGHRLRNQPKHMIQVMFGIEEFVVKPQGEKRKSRDGEPSRDGAQKDTDPRDARQRKKSERKGYTKNKRVHYLPEDRARLRHPEIPVEYHGHVALQGPIVEERGLLKHVPDCHPGNVQRK